MELLTQPHPGLQKKILLFVNLSLLASLGYGAQLSQSPTLDDGVYVRDPDATQYFVPAPVSRNSGKRKRGHSESHSDEVEGDTTENKGNVSNVSIIVFMWVNVCGVGGF